MDIGIGIPNTVPGVTGQQLLDWARRADTAGLLHPRNDRTGRLPRA